MGTIKEGLEAALGELEVSGGDSAPVIDTSATLDPAPAVDTPTDNAPPAPVDGRDAQGRFAKKDTPAPADAPPVQVQRPEPPKSWKADKRAQWDTLDPAVAEYIHQRETEQAKGFDEYRATRDPLFKQVEPYLGELRERGMQPELVARDLFYTHKLLMNGDAPTKIQTLVNIAQAYGIPMGQWLQGGGVPDQVRQMLDPGVVDAARRAREAEFREQQLRSEQDRAINEQASAQVALFKESHPYVDQLAPEMQRLLQSGIAADLESAYSKALRLNDKLFEQTQAQQREEAEKQRRIEADKAAKAAKANAVSTRTATPGTAANGAAPKGRHAALTEAFDQITANRM